MSISPVSYQEINAYNQCHNYVLTENEIDIIKEMSTNYVSEINNKNPTKKPPYGTYSMQSNNFVKGLQAMAKQADKK